MAHLGLTLTLCEFPLYCEKEVNFIAGTRWGRQIITYKISKYPHFRHGLSHPVVNSEIERAFQIWSTVTGLKFKMVKNEKSDLEIR